jgi:spore coat polysaccharide biosynthesis protein SpsF
MNTNVQAIIQARTESMRLPRKVLAKIDGMSLLELLIRRMKLCYRLTSIVVATTDRKEDDPIVDIARNLGVHFYRGSSNDVLSRFLGSIERFPSDVTVRVTADNPLTDPKLIDQLIKEHLERRAEYTIPLGCPLGTGAEVVNTIVFQKIKDIPDISMREHVTLYIVRHPYLFSIHKVKLPFKSEISVTVDDPRDLSLLRRFISTQKDPLKITIDDILEFERKKAQD